MPDGRRRSVFGRTRAEAIRKLTRAIRDRDYGMPFHYERLTVAKFLTQWLEDSVKPAVRFSTYVSYSYLMQAHASPALGRIALARLTPQVVQKFLNDKLASGLSPRRVQYLHAVLRRALGQAEKWGLVSRNVAKLVDPPRVQHPEIKPLTPEESRIFLGTAVGHRLEALYIVAICLGLRQGEVLGLHWQDIDLEKGTLFVRHSLQRIDGKLQLIEPKTARSRRTIALPSLAIRALRKHRVWQMEERLAKGSAWLETGQVFTTRVGTPLDARNVVRQFHMLLDQAGLPRIRFHDLRHTAASLLLTQGVHPRVVMETLGHSQISLTMNVYSHVLPALQREAANSMDAILRRPD